MSDKPDLIVGSPNIPAEYAGGRELTTDEAIALGEWHLILHDLQTAERNVQLLQKVYTGPNMGPETHTIAEALFRDAIIQFMACFGDPKKYLLTVEEVYAGRSGALTDMQYLRDLRDTFAAHNFGPMRQAYIIVTPGEDASALRPLRLVYSLPIPATLPAYAALIRSAQKAAADKILAVHAVVVEQLIALGLDGIAVLPLVSLRTAQPDEMRQSRKAFRKGSPQRGHGGSRGQKS